ncbi:MAG: alpha/beta family hydrolase [Rhodomicrobium sp.]
MELQPITIRVDDAITVPGLLQVPPKAQACFVFAHGAGAGMTHPFMAAVAAGLFDLGVATLRYQFPYMERGPKRPDPPKIAQASVRAAVKEASSLLPDIALIAGGKSFGGRMTSQAQAAKPLPNVLGLAFLGFPLHGAGQPSRERAEHLFGVEIPMLFLQGTHDALAEVNLIRGVCDELGIRATLKLFEDAGHSFNLPARSGRSNAEVLNDLTGTLADWIKSVAQATPQTLT